MARMRRRPALPRVEELNSRINPAPVATFSNGLLTVTDDPGAVSDQMVLVASVTGDAGETTWH